LIAVEPKHEGTPGTPLKNQAQSTSSFMSAATNQKGCLKGSPW